MSKLILVPTPIGNLQDMTFRAVEVLKNADLILAEDTRTSAVLLKHFAISTGLSSYHKFNEHKQVPQIIAKLQSGMTIALISDAGTPGISDPGFLIVRACVRNNIAVETLPGASAFIPALVNSGLPCERFCFEGFLEHKKGRQKHLKELTEEKRTMVFYESPFRLVKTLKQFMEVFGENRQASVSRELTKIYEENKGGTLKELYEFYEKKSVKGEIVIVVEGCKKKKTND